MGRNFLEALPWKKKERDCSLGFEVPWVSPLGGKNTHEIYSPGPPGTHLIVLLLKLYQVLQIRIVSVIPRIFLLPRSWEEQSSQRKSPCYTASEGGGGSWLQGCGGPESWVGVNVCGTLPHLFLGERLHSNRDPSVAVAQSFDLRSIVSQWCHRIPDVWHPRAAWWRPPLTALGPPDRDTIVSHI